MPALLIAQFLSALADNAILIVAIALVKARGEAASIAFLQGAFVLPFIVLAPFVGQIADRFPKARVMLWANALKLAGAAAMGAGADPFAAYGLIGVGAAAYSPAKYGILSQLVEPARLVRANGLLEGSTIAAILLGVLAGGWLADHSVQGAFAAIIGAYALAWLANGFMPAVGAERPEASLRPGPMVKAFGHALAHLLRQSDARFGLLGTSLFWAVGATLRLMLFAWVPLALGLTDNQTPAQLMGVVSVGIVLGAAAAGRWIGLHEARRALIGGLLLGPVILLLAITHQWPIAIALMASIGVCGGLFVVPLNALVQQRGHASVGAGHALAVQNILENAAMLLLTSAWAAAARAAVPIDQALLMLGAGVLIAVAVLARGQSASRRQINAHRPAQ